LRLTTPVASPSTSHRVDRHQWQQSSVGREAELAGGCNRPFPQATWDDSRAPGRRRVGVRHCSDAAHRVPRRTRGGDGSLWFPVVSSIAAPCRRCAPSPCDKSHIPSVGGMPNWHNSHPSIPCHSGQNADCHAEHTGSWIEGQRRGALTPVVQPSLGRDDAAICQATRLRVRRSWVPSPLPILPAHVEKEALGPMFACLSLLAPSGPKENRASDEGWFKLQLVVAPFSPEHAMNPQVGGVQTPQSRDGLRFPLVQRR